MTGLILESRPGRAAAHAHAVACRNSPGDGAADGSGGEQGDYTWDDTHKNLLQSSTASISIGPDDGPRARPEPSGAAAKECAVNTSLAIRSKIVRRFIAAAARDETPVRGLTHCFYRYPARFSPAFVRRSIEAFSRPGDTVLDPHMGGGTTVVEAMVLGRRGIGSDVNSLAVFVARVKVAELSDRERRVLLRWAAETVQQLKCSDPVRELDSRFRRVPQNLALPNARWLRKTISLCLASIDTELPTTRSRRFARCVLLNVGQWALNGRKRIPTARDFRERVRQTTVEMLAGVAELAQALTSLHVRAAPPIIVEADAERIDQEPRVTAVGPADLVVTSPPYPGIHMLYHRWQVDGRKETDAPYWIAACNDGAGAAFYNFADRRRYAEDQYFGKAERSFSAIRSVMRTGATLVQMIAFSEPPRQLRRYLSILERAGFRELREYGGRRTWRSVPGRRWHANFKGRLSSSREVVLMHVAD